MAQRETECELTAEQEAEASRIAELVKHCGEEEILNMARLVASKDDGEIFGETEFQLRDILHRLGAKLLETATNERRKKGLSR